MTRANDADRSRGGFRDRLIVGVVLIAAVLLWVLLDGDASVGAARAFVLHILRALF